MGAVLATFAVGVVAGALSALLGIGGAVVTTPAVRVLGATPIEAVGSTVPAILPGAISGSIRYAKAGLVDWTLALGLGVSGAVFALAGAWVSDLVGGRPLMVLTAVLMLWSGVSVGRGADRPPSEEAEPQGPRSALWLISLVGAASGFVAGLLGVGGGIVMVPAMTGPLRIPMKRAVASSLVAVAIFSVPALVAHLVLGHIDWRFALPLMAGVVPGAQLGAHMTIGAAEHHVRRWFGVLVVVVALVYGFTELAALF
ncbi:MAG: sulfite exporter TauE/SafE family protein [Microthrixaceae bacterium]